MSYDLRRGTLAEGIAVVLARVHGARASNPEYLERCAVCFLAGFCEQCPAKSSDGARHAGYPG